MVGNITRLLLKRRIGMIKVTVYNEFVHEKEQENVKKVYPNGMHAAIKEFLEADGRFEVKTATLDMPEHGLTKEVLDDTVYLYGGDTVLIISFQTRSLKEYTTKFCQVWEWLFFIPDISQRFSKNSTVRDAILNGVKAETRKEFG